MSNPLQKYHFSYLAALFLTVVIAALGSGISLAQEDPLTAPSTTLSADGRSATDGVRTLTVSKANGISAAGEMVTVTGSGYNMEKGIYVAFCVIPPQNQIPTPCGGGVGGAGTASIWISSNPPSYGEGLATPYDPGGSFSSTLNLVTAINSAVDCRVQQCGVVTRNDHTRASDRSQDIFIPVTFAAPAATPPPAGEPQAPPAPGAQPVAPAPTPAPQAGGSNGQPIDNGAPATATPAPVAAPAVVVSDDGRTARSGSMILTVSSVSGLDPAGEELTVSGAGFDESRGIYVALCAIPKDGSGPGPCAAGSADVSAWVSSNPPDYGQRLALPYSSGGAFEVSITAKAAIDGETDCREVECAIVTRADDSRPDDRSQDIAVPVSFASENSPAREGDEVAATDDDDDGGGIGMLPWVGAAILALIVGIGAFFVFRRWRGGTALPLILGVLLLAGCGTTASSQQDSSSTAPGATPDESIVVLEQVPEPQLPVTVTDAEGREVTIEDTSRIVPLWGNIAEIVFGLGLGENVVARDISATFPEAEDLPLVTRAHDVSAESVLSLNPTVVLASEDTGPELALDHIRNVGIPVVVFEEPDEVDDVVPRIKTIAAALGVPAAGDELVALTEDQMADAQETIPGDSDSPRVAFLYMRGNAGVFLLGGPGSGADSMIAAAGGIDAGTEMGLDQAFTPITSEALVEAAPDIILMTSTGLDSVGGVDGLVEIPGIAQTPAGQDRRVVTMEDGLLYSFGPRSPLAIKHLISAFFAG